MIRASDLFSSAAGWARPSAPVGAASRTDASRDPAGWFDAGSEGELRIGGDVSPEARGLRVEQHAARVLMQLCGEADPAA